MTTRQNFDRLTLLTALTSIAAYCVAEGSGALAAVALPSAMAAWWLRGRAFAAEVPRIALNLILLAVIAYAILTFVEGPVGVEDIARLIVVLLVIKLYDRQSARDAAQSLSLSLFLSIASILTSVRFELAALLLPLIPMFIGATMQYQIIAGHEAAARASKGTTGGAGGPSPRMVCGPRWRRQLRWVTAGSALGITGIAAVVFMLVPRGVNADFLRRWSLPSASLETRFTSTVQLGRGGFLSESQRVVLNLGVTDEQGAPLGGPDIVFRLRGNILDEYDTGGHAWRRSEAQAQRDRNTQWAAGVPLPMGTPEGGMIVQDIRLVGSSQGQRFLFSVLRPVRWTFGSSARLLLNESDRRVVALETEGEMRYRVESVHPDRPPRGQARAPRRSYGPASFDSAVIGELTAGVLRDAGLDPGFENRDIAGDSRACRAIQAYLRENYAYTTEILASPAGTDPIEWFLLERREGHCEYFASAMAAMCRSVGIPARVVAGYIAAEWNEASGDYVVRESNAHAWVEALIADNDWRTFDPTPSTDLLRLHRPAGGLLTRLRHVFDAMEQAWITSVVSYNQGAGQQRLERAASRRQDWYALAQKRLDDIRRGGFGLVIRAAIVGLVAFGLVIVGARLGPGLLRRLRARATGRLAMATAGEPHAPWRLQTRFYARLLRDLERRGVAKPAWSPPLHHAETIAERDPPAAAAAGRLTSLYYEARFGTRLLTEREVEEAEAALAVLMESAPKGRGAAAVRE